MSQSRIALKLEYLTVSDRVPQRRRGGLGGAVFGRPPDTTRAGGGELGFPLAEVRMPVLGGARAVLELWSTGDEVRAGCSGRLQYAASPQVLFGGVSVVEAEALPGAADGDHTPLTAATGEAYREILATVASAGYPHLLRVWNVIPEINAETHGLERYRQFNGARQQALLESGRAISGGVPAASALGAAAGGPLVVYFLALRRAPTYIENPRQVSAYHYPLQYGPRSPAFSRAAVIGERDAAMLFISGTASIVGHRTLHAGDPAAQTRETLANIEALIGAAARTVLARRVSLESLTYKVFVRDAAELPAIRSVLEEALGPRTAVLYLNADICRRDLAVEIEAVGGPGLAAGD